VALTAWADDAYRGGSLKVGTEDRWGDLAFSAQADPPTRLQRLTDSLNLALAPALSLGRATLIVLTAGYGVLLAIVCYIGMRTWRRVAPWPTAVNQVARVEQPRKWTLHWIRVVAAVSFAVATPLLFTAILVTRERVSVHLLDQLDVAQMESPAGMHVGFSRIEEVINGFSPPALFAHPPSRVTWRVTVPAQKPVLETNIALRPYVWEHRSDGVTFDVTITDGSHKTRVSRFLNPGVQLNDRAWVDMGIDLSEYEGRTVEV
jgi:hypothetical protein